MKTRRLLLALVVLILTGCAPYQPSITHNGGILMPSQAHHIVLRDGIYHFEE